MFKDRKEAGQQLVSAPSYLKDEAPVVVGLPHGGVPAAFELANPPMLRFLMVVLAVALLAAGGAAAEDTRTGIKRPAEMRDHFLEHMRDHMDSPDEVMAQLAGADFKEPAKVAREQLVPGSGKGLGRYLPVGFREMRLGMHRAAADFAEFVENIPSEPTVADRKEAVAALQAISAQCRACQSTFRIE